MSSFASTTCLVSQCLSVRSPGNSRRRVPVKDCDQDRPSVPSHPGRRRADLLSGMHGPGRHHARTLPVQAGSYGAPGEPVARLAARLLLTVTPARRRLAGHSVGCQPEPGSDSESDSEGAQARSLPVTVTCHVIWRLCRLRARVRGSLRLARRGRDWSERAANERPGPAPPRPAPGSESA
jgi:hypothetical protein